MKKLITFLLLLIPFALHAQVAVAPIALPRAQFLNATGQPLAAGCVNFFATGTSTPQAIYADSGGVNQLQNPLTLDAAGEASIWMSNTGYDIVANTGVANTACSVSLGTPLWREINKNPFSIINQGSNFIVASGTSDPSGVAGELAYRTDIPCFRGFTTIWDCFVTLSAPQTLTNKTLTTPVINNASGATLIQPSIAGLTLGGVSVAAGNPTNFANFTNGAAGTTLNQLAKLVVVGSGVNSVNTAITDTNGVIGIVIAGAGTSGINLVQRTGQALCVFDGSTTANDYVQISPTIVGNCHDAGASSYPAAGGDVIGRVLTTNAGVGTYLIDLFSPEIRTPQTNTVTAVNLTAQAANVVSTPILTPSANGFYRFNAWIVVTQAGSTSGTVPSLNLIFTDADSSTAQTVQISAANTSNTVGLFGVGYAGGLGATGFSFFAKSGVSINYQTTGYASVGGTPLQYALHIRLEGPF